MSANVFLLQWKAVYQETEMDVSRKSNLYAGISESLFSVRISCIMAVFLYATGKNISNKYNSRSPGSQAKKPDEKNRRAHNSRCRIHLTLLPNRRTMVDPGKNDPLSAAYTILDVGMKMSILQQRRGEKSYVSSAEFTPAIVSLKHIRFFKGRLRPGGVSCFANLMIRWNCTNL